jgi:hypothetical protein
LTGIFLGQDLFNLYVAIEVLTFSAADPVVAGGRCSALRLGGCLALGKVLGPDLGAGPHGRRPSPGPW